MFEVKNVSRTLLFAEHFICEDMPESLHGPDRQHFGNAPLGRLKASIVNSLIVVLNDRSTDLKTT